MNEQIIIAGFGGQGILSAGKMLAEAAMEEGCEVSWLPSYGPEMRGGTSNVNIILSDTPIGAPTISMGKATCVIVMNRPSLEKYEQYLMPGGLLVMNSSFIEIKPKRDDIHIVHVPANEIAQKVGNDKVANMVVLGAYISKTDTVKTETLIHVLTEVLGEKKMHLIELNREAIKLGSDCLAA